MNRATILHYQIWQQLLHDYFTHCLGYGLCEIFMELEESADCHQILSFGSGSEINVQSVTRLSADTFLEHARPRAHDDVIFFTLG